MASAVPNEPDSQHDLIIRTIPSFSFHNRWRFSERDELVDYDCIRDWHFTLLQNNSHLKRIKIYRLSKQRISKLLRSLSVHRERSQLNHLEIDRLEVEIDDLRAYYRLDALQSLWIGAVSLVDKDGIRLKSVRSGTNVSVTFNTPNLRMLYLGSNSIQHVRFPDPSNNITDLTIGPLTDVDQLAGFISLERLMVVGAERSNVDALVQLAEREGLRELHFNLLAMNSTEFKPDSDSNQLAFLERLYERLQEVHERTKKDHLDILREGKPTNDDRIEVFFNHVQLDFGEPFAGYYFDEPLIDLHYRHIVLKGSPLVPCRSVSELNYLGLFKNFLQLMPGGEVQEAKTVFSILKFLRLYPSIRVVVLNNLGTKKGEGPNPKLFLDLLRDCCRSLTELRVLYSDFEGDFYTDLVKVKSVSQTLDRLTIMEACPSRRLVDFGALLGRLPCLHQLTTNVASRETMIEAAGKMAYASAFEFTYWEGTEEADFYCCEIRRADGDDYVLVVRRICRDDRPDLLVYNSRLSLRLMAEYFDKPENAYITQHWHETLKRPKLVVRTTKPSSRTV